MNIFLKLIISAALIVSALVSSFFAEPQWYVKKNHYHVVADENGQLSYQYNGQTRPIAQATPVAESQLWKVEEPMQWENTAQTEWVYTTDNSDKKQYYQLSVHKHFGLWSLLPALLAIAFSFLTRQPLIGLFTGIIAGAILLGKWQILQSVFLPAIGTERAAAILILYLWLLGGLLGIWAKTGATQLFAQKVTERLVHSPQTAKFCGWLLGVIFFQGGTMSTVLAGTTVKPISDAQKVSHEEMSYIVDSTASPVAIVLPFNAWPFYVQALIYLPGVSFLATESQRIAFFFASIPLSFYALLAILGTLLFCFDYSFHVGKGLRKAMVRSRKSGALDAPNAMPLSELELHHSKAKNYRPIIHEFLLPLILLISIAIGTFVATGSPNVSFGFGAALFTAMAIALFRGMSFQEIINGFGNGVKGLVLASILMLLAIVIGTINVDIGSGYYLIKLLGDQIPIWALPVILFLGTLLISFATGSSWGTFAIAFPIALPLAWHLANGLDLAYWYMLLCFATILNGSVFGDQCSPLSDTTILSATAVGADVIDHVKTQLQAALIAGSTACLLWTILALIIS